jgi:hypothetical protein
MGDTLALIGVLFGYLALCVVPPFLWSRTSLYHPVWRGVEALICYAGVALVMGGIFTFESGTRWSAMSGLWAGGNAWGRIGSLVILSGAFILASLWGGMAAEGKTRRHKSKTRRKKA